MCVGGCQVHSVSLRKSCLCLGYGVCLASCVCVCVSPLWSVLSGSWFIVSGGPIGRDGEGLYLSHKQTDLHTETHVRRIDYNSSPNQRRTKDGNENQSEHVILKL